MKITEIELLKEIAKDPEPLIIYGVCVCIVNVIIAKAYLNYQNYYLID